MLAADVTCVNADVDGVVVHYVLNALNICLGRTADRVYHRGAKATLCETEPDLFVIVNIFDLISAKEGEAVHDGACVEFLFHPVHDTCVIPHHVLHPQHTVLLYAAL